MEVYVVEKYTGDYDWSLQCICATHDIALSRMQAIIDTYDQYDDEYPQPETRMYQWTDESEIHETGSFRFRISKQSILIN